MDHFNDSFMVLFGASKLRNCMEKDVDKLNLSFCDPQKKESLLGGRMF